MEAEQNAFDRLFLDRNDSWIQPCKQPKILKKVKKKKELINTFFFLVTIYAYINRGEIES